MSDNVVLNGDTADTILQYPANNNILINILKNLAYVDKHDCRLVCKDWNNAFASPEINHDLVYVIDGINPGTLFDSTQTLWNSSLPWRNYKMKNMELDRDFLRDEHNFVQFTREKCPHLRSLTLEKCVVKLGRFLELVAFCIEIRELRVDNCPSIYITGIELTRWATLFEAFDRRLGSLETLVLNEKKLPNVYTLSAWLIKMNQLKKLLISSETEESSQDYPSLAVLIGVKRNIDTLKELVITGKCNERERFWEQMNVEQLIPHKLEKLRVDTISLNKLNTVIHLFKDLKVISLVSLKIDQATFRAIHELPKLESIYLELCELDFNVLVDQFSKCKKLKAVSLINNTMRAVPYSDYTILDEYCGFFGNTMSDIEAISLEEKNISRLIQVMVEKPTKLTTLVLSDCTGLSTASLFPLWSRRIRSTLKVMDLSSTDIDDSTFNDYIRLSQFEALQDLNLSKTKIGDTTFSDDSAFTELKNLTNLWLTETEITGLTWINLGPILPQLETLAIPEHLILEDGSVLNYEAIMDAENEKIEEGEEEYDVEYEDDDSSGEEDNED